MVAMLASACLFFFPSEHVERAEKAFDFIDVEKNAKLRADEGENESCNLINKIHSAKRPMNVKNWAVFIFSTYSREVHADNGSICTTRLNCPLKAECS